MEKLLTVVKQFDVQWKPKIFGIICDFEEWLTYYFNFKKSCGDANEGRIYH